jgi:FkbM family methyltransferase
MRYARRFPRSRVFAFEPLPSNQRLITANFNRYAVTNATLVPLALSDRAGEAIFHVSAGRPADEFAGKDWNYGNKSSSLLAPARSEPMYGWVEFKETIKVPTGTLDEFCRDRTIARVDFIHMDVQGAEHLVLQGARTMLPHILAVWLEVSDQPLYKGQRLRGDIEEFMQAHGFTLAFELRREIEGDQFYLNHRHARFWPALALHRAATLGRHVRRAAGRVKRALLG